MTQQRRRAQAAADVAAEVLPFPRAAARSSRGRKSWLPSTRSLVIGLCLVATAGGGYLLARETSAFAVRRIEVNGATPALATRVQAALGPLVGSSLLSFDRGEAARRVLRLPEIADASFDRNFPHTLRVAVRLERPAAVARQGSLAWLVSLDARVLRALSNRPYPALPRVWLPQSTDVVVGGTLGGDAAEAIRALAPPAARRLPIRLRTVIADQGVLTFVLADGTEVRLGEAANLSLKLAVAGRILAETKGSTYVDVSVPERAVADFNPQVGG